MRTWRPCSPCATTLPSLAGSVFVGNRVRDVLAFGGSPCIAHDFQNEIRRLGIASSPAFVRAPEGNGCAERFIRTFKDNLLWVRTFDSIEEISLALLAFQKTCNEHWLIERHDHRSPAQFRRDQLDSRPMAA